MTFDAVNRLIIVGVDVTLLDAEADLYSAAKREWKNNVILNKLRLPFRTVAGDPLGQNLEVGAYFFLQNQAGSDWRIRPDEVDHELMIVGNLYAEDVDLPMFVPTLGEYTVTVSIEKSSLTQKIGSDLTSEEIADEVWDAESRGLKLDELRVMVALEETLAAIKGSGWTEETLRKIKQLNDEIKQLIEDLGPIEVTPKAAFVL